MNVLEKRIKKYQGNVKEGNKAKKHLKDKEKDN